MKAINQQYSLNKRVKDDKFDVDHLENYSLTLHIGADVFQLSIFDVNSNKCLLVEDYTLHDANTSEKKIEVLTSLFESHHLLLAGFWNNLKISFKNRKFTLIPASLFEEERADEYLQLTCELDVLNEEVNYFYHSSGKYVSVFAVDKKLVDWARNIYPSVSLKIYHQSCAVIEGVLHYEDHPVTDGMFVYFHRNELQVVVTSRKQLVFYNTFHCKSKEEFLKYILLIFQELKLNQYQTKVFLWGDLNKESPFYQTLYKYIKHVHFARKPNYLKFDFQFDEVNDHEYLDVYGINLCN